MSSNYSQNRGAGGGAAQPRKKTLFNDWRQPHPVSDNPVEGSKYPAQLMWTQANNNRILLQVSDGVYKEGGNKHKEVEMDWADRNDLFEALLEAATNENFESKFLHIRKKDFVRTGGQSRLSDQPVTKVILVIARGKDQRVRLSWGKGDYKVTFTFKGARDTIVMTRGADGQMVEDHGAISRWATRRWVNFFRAPLDEIERNTWEPMKPKEGTTGGGGGGGNNYAPRNNGGGSGGNAEVSTDYDEDLDF